MEEKEADYKIKAIKKTIKNTIEFLENEKD